MAVNFSPKILGLSVGIFETVSRIVKTGFLELLSGSLRLG